VHGLSTNGAGPTLDAKVSFLSRPDAYRPAPGEIVCRETHMSWVFLAGDRVYKLKKPVRFSYLNFSTLARREAACRAELRLNRALAPDIYLDVLPLVDTGDGLAIGGTGTTVDWLVLMKRLDEHDMLDRRIAESHVEISQLERLVAVLAQFYHAASPVFLSPAIHLADWRRSLAYNRRLLLDRRFGIPAGLVQRIDHAQRRFWTGAAASSSLAFAIAGSSRAMATCVPNIFASMTKCALSTASNSTRGFGWSTRSTRLPISVSSASGSVRLGSGPLSNAG
jgi:hypothetical protein